jgi:hypothetical protein
MNQVGWQYDPETIGGTGRIVSLGYVANCKPDCLVLTTSIGTSGGAVSPISIPWRAIETLDLVGKAWNR